MRTQIIVETTDDEMGLLLRSSISHGYMRENPRKVWTDKERKEAIRLVVSKLVEAELVKLRSQYW